MKTTEAAKLARELMDQHGLQHIRLTFDNSKTALGRCFSIGNKAHRISLSRYWTIHLPEENVRDTILHEIAHALVGVREKHGPVWREMARKIGANPKRIAELPYGVQKDIVAKISKYRAVCVSCDKAHYFDRYTKSWRSGKYICKCGGSLKVFQN